MLLLVGVVVASCDDSPASAEGRLGAPGVTRVPSSPLLPGPIPGWHLEVAELHAASSPAPQQTLYLGDGSTARHGPAIVVGRFSEEEGSLLCGRGTSVGAKLRPAYPGQTTMRRHRNLIAVSGDLDPESTGYVLARDVSERDVLRATRAADFETPVSSIPRRALPDGFHHAATAPIPPNSLGLDGSEELVLGNDDPSTPYDIRLHPDTFVNVSAFDGDRPTRVLTRFWRATANTVGCGGRQFVARRIGRTNVLAWGSGVSRRVVERVVASLAPVGTATFEEQARSRR